MTEDTWDIVVAGGGLAGLIATRAFAELGFKTLCIDPASKALSFDDPGADFRSTALLQPSRDFLEEIGIWAHLSEDAMPLETMRMVDAAGQKASERVSRDFCASDISERPFGWNLPNWRIHQGLDAAMKGAPLADLRRGLSVTALWPQTERMHLTLSDGSRLRTKLLIGADGKRSFVREALGIETRTTDFGQSALAFAVSHPIPHGNVSTEIHLSGGPFTLVPLPDYENRPASAVVWMEDTQRAKALAALPQDDFEREMSERSGYALGQLKRLSPPALWPITSQAALQFYGQRTALIAEAAHAMPPIGAQGLNTSIKDISVLHGLLKASPGAIGDDRMLIAYDRKRRLEVQARMAGVGILNRVSQSGLSPIQKLRALGISQLSDIAPLRRTVMRLGMGSR
ncbi:MAG: FAD-dependent monooxygenase [Pseudomonadota bacterium]